VFRRSPELPLTWQDVNALMAALMGIEGEVNAIHDLLLEEFDGEEEPDLA
jgi:hypothetical protein